MDKASSEVLELIKEGTAAIGKVGVEFWPELVRYNVALALAALGVSLIILALGLTLLFVTNRSAKKAGKTGDEHEAGYVAGGITAGIGFVAVLTTGYWATAALIAPEAYTVMQLIGK